MVIKNRDIKPGLRVKMIGYPHKQGIVGWFNGYNVSVTVTDIKNKIIYPPTQLPKGTFKKFYEIDEVAMVLYGKTNRT